LGRIAEKVHESSGNVNLLFKTHAGPPVPQKCAECDSALHVSMRFDMSLCQDRFIITVDRGPDVVWALAQ